MTRERHNGIPDTVQKPTKETVLIEGCTARFDFDTKNPSVSIYGEEYECVAALMRFGIGEDDGIRKEGNADDTIVSLVFRANAWQKEARERILETLRRHGGRVTYTPENEDGEYPVAALMYGKHDYPRIDITAVYLEEETCIMADGIDTDGGTRTGFRIYDEQLYDIALFLKYVL